MGFRADVLPIIILAIDTTWRDPDAGDRSPDGCPGDAGRDTTVEAVEALGARFVGVAAEVATDAPLLGQMQDLAEASGALADLDGDGETEPVVVSWARSGPGLDELVSDALLGLVDAAVFSEVWLEAAPPPDSGAHVTTFPERLGETRASDALNLELRATLSHDAAEAVEVPLRLMGMLDGRPVVLQERTLWLEWER